jgi:hypothetical protein
MRPSRPAEWYPSALLISLTGSGKNDDLKNNMSGNRSRPLAPVIEWARHIRDFALLGAGAAPSRDIQMTKAIVDIARPLGISVHDGVVRCGESRRRGA